MIDENLTIALLIDGENLDAKYIETITDELSALGRVTYKRLYGAIGNPKTDAWRKVANEHSITMMTQYTYTSGKNASDVDMAINAMDILYSGNVNAFCIMSNDSDFTGLAKRLKESNVYVFGAGLSTATASFKNVCDRFFTLDDLDKQRELENEKSEKTANSKSKKKASKKDATPDGEQSLKQSESATDISTSPKKATKEEILMFVKRLFTSTGKSVLDSGDITKKIYQRYPDFDYRSYGAKKSYQFFEGKLFEVVRTENSNINIKLKD